MKNILKKNQIIIYTFALMLVAAGYLNYTNRINAEVTSSSEVANINEATYTNENTDVNQTTDINEVADTNEVADIGDATLVSSNDVVTNSTENKEALANETAVVSEKQSDNDEYFTKSKLERETMYSQMIESYENILNSSNSLETQKQAATEEITKINETKNSIMICENLIETKGFSKSVVFVNGESVNVVIGESELQKEETAQIQNIVSRELSVDISNIHITTKEIN